MVLPGRLVRILLIGVSALAWARPAAGQALLQANSPHPAILVHAYLGTSQLLLTPPAAADALVLRADGGPGRMGAYMEFERSMRLRTERIAGAPSSGSERAREKQELLAGLGARLDGLPGASLVRDGTRLWRRVSDLTDVRFDGYRVRLRMGEAVEGRLALKVQKQLQ